MRGILSNSMEIKFIPKTNGGLHVLIKLRKLFNEIYTDKASLKKTIGVGVSSKMLAILKLRS